MVVGAPISNMDTYFISSLLFRGAFPYSVGLKYIQNSNKFNHSFAQKLIQYYQAIANNSL